MASPYQSPAPLPPAPPSPDKKKQSFLAWWGIVPALVFFALEGVFNWPIAKEVSKDTAQASGYLVGHTLGGLLISCLIAWIVYRLSKRSQTASTIAFSILIALTSMSILRESRMHAAEAALAPTVISADEFQFESPRGWRRDPPTGENMKVLLVQPTINEVSGVMQVAAGQAAFPSAKQMAQSIAGPDGRILPNPALVDGIAGIRVETAHTDLSRPRHVIVVPQNGKMYLIMAAAAEGHDVAADFDHVLKTWRWTPKR